MLQVTCPECGHVFPVAESYGGRTITCIRCNAPVEAPIPIAPIRQQARKQPAPKVVHVQDGKSSPLLAGLLIGCLSLMGIGAACLVGLFVLGSLSPRRPSAPSTSANPTRPATPSFGVGDAAQLVTTAPHGRINLAVGDGDENWNALLEAENEGGIRAIAELIRQGKVFTVQSGTRVRILNGRIFSYKVRIEEESVRGVTPREGESGWVEKEFVRPL